MLYACNERKRLLYKEWHYFCREKLSSYSRSPLFRKKAIYYAWQWELFEFRYVKTNYVAASITEVTSSLRDWIHSPRTKNILRDFETHKKLFPTEYIFSEIIEKLEALKKLGSMFRCYFIKKTISQLLGFIVEEYSSVIIYGDFTYLSSGPISFSLLKVLWDCVMPFFLLSSKSFF